jgi:hypothetical protein
VARDPRPSRYARSDPPTVVLTDEQIVAAIARAVALRQHTAIRPDDVHGQPMTAHDAVRMTESWRLHTQWYRMARSGQPDPDPWWWIGWVGQETPRGVVDELNRRCYHRTWAVWLNAADGRVWLRWERHGYEAIDAPYP